MSEQSTLETVTMQEFQQTLQVDISTPVISSIPCIPDQHESRPTTSSSPDAGITVTCSAGFLAAIKSKSCSRVNFSANLVRSLFTEEERKTSNVNGKNKKKKLDEVRMQSVKEATMYMYPCEVGKKVEQVWIGCIKAIDESNRRINRTK